jgi:hypothetical protein
LSKYRALRFRDEAEARAVLQLGARQLPAAPEPEKKHKYNAKATVVDGIKFPSKREAARYTEMAIRQRLGEVLFFLRQVPFHMPGGTRLVVDFLEVPAHIELEIDGRVVRIAMIDVIRAGGIRVKDAKGVETDSFKIKRREIHHHYPVKVEVV